MMDVSVISAEDGLLGNEAPEDRQSHVGQRHGQGKDRSNRRRHSGRLPKPDKAEAAQHEARPEASGISQENRCGVEIEKKKAQQRARHGSGQYTHNAAAQRQRDEQHR